MSTNHLVDEVGHWKKEKILGAGGFGYVVLWRNKETNNTIALKECRWGHDPMMTPKHRSRWKFEVDMMFRLDHPNVVKAIPVPSELDVPPTELPLLAMEFCSNGDLRKLLSKPENCRGLKEKHVRLIMKHTSSAINYLHSMKIIHRDLKPENIVIQNQNGSVIYKLIDLGYAKELDQGSLCTSFVGTLQYLAPELFMSQKYSGTVDYWSLGLVAHEVITGERPFLPDKSPAEWIPIIRQKNSTQIRAYLDEDKNIVFSSEIAPCHYISDTFKQDVENWLQLMLDWDPKKRGRNENTTFFSLLETILNKKVALVFCVETLRLHSFPISEELTLEEFSHMLEKETKIPVNQQEIILSNGHFPDPKKGAIQFVSNMEEEEIIIFLTNSEDTLSPCSPSSVTFITPSVEKMMRNPRQEVEYITQRTNWSEAVHLCQQECMRISRVSLAFKANILCLLTKTSNPQKLVSYMTVEMSKLMAKCSFFKCSLERDIKHCEKQNRKKLLSSQQMLQEWKSNLENLKKIDLLRQKVIELETCYSNITRHVMALQKYRSTRSKLTSPIEEVYNKVIEAYADLRRRPKEQRRFSHDNTDFVRLLCLCLQHSHAQIEELLLQIRKIKQVKQDINSCEPQIINLSYETVEWEAQVDKWQSQRQLEIWELIQTLNIQTCQIEGSKSPSLISYSSQSVAPSKRITGQVVPKRCSSDPSHGILKESLKLPIVCPPVIIPKPIPSKTAPLDINSSFLKEDSLHTRSLSSGMSLSTLLNQTLLDNDRVKKENQELAESFQAMMNVLQNFKDSSGTEKYKKQNDE